MHRIPSPRGHVPSTVLDAARRAIERCARQAVPALADFCLVHLAGGRTIRCVAGAHSTRAGARDVRALMAAHRISQDDRVSTVAHVVRTGRPSLRTTIPPEPDGGGYVSRVAQLHRRLAPGSVLVVPIRQHGNVTGAVSLCYSHSGRSYRTRDVAIAEGLASGIAGVVDRIAATEVSAALDARRAGAAPGSPLRRRTAQRS